MVLILGIDLGCVYVVIFVVGVGFSGFVGGFLVFVFGVFLNMGVSYVVKVFVIVIVGGSLVLVGMIGVVFMFGLIEVIVLLILIFVIG